MLQVKGSYIMWVVCFLGLFAITSDVMALTDLHDPSGSLTGLLDLVKQQSLKWDVKLRVYANTLFWLLAVIQLVWTFMPLVFRQADMGEIVGELVRFIMIIGFFYALLLFSSDWADKIVSSFRLAGANAAGLGDTQIRPGDIFGVAIQLAYIIGDFNTLNPMVGMMISLAELVVLLCFTFISGFMALCIIESYIVINASVLFMGFGGSQWTREYAVASIRYAVSVGTKLFILTLIVGIIVESAKTWQMAYNHDNASMWTMVGLAIVCAYLAKTIPELIAGMISGSSMSGGSMIGGMAAAAVAGATAAIATIKTSGASNLMGSAESAGSLASSINSSLSEGPNGAFSASTSSLSSDIGAFTGGGETAKDVQSATGNPVTDIASQSSGSGLDNQTANTFSQQSSDSTQQDSSSVANKKEGDTSTHQSSDTTEQQNGNAAQENKSGNKVAAGLVRGAGILAAISVPGMESTAGLSIGAGLPEPIQNSLDNADFSMAPSKGKESQNIIRPETTKK
ncbi:MAG: P-type conjugative transfer protein TrbL [Gammaproteobacteria bacterium]